VEKGESIDDYPGEKRKKKFRKTTTATKATTTTGTTAATGAGYSIIAGFYIDC